MPAADVSDLKDLFDAIDRMCETMRTSNYEDADTFEDRTIGELAEATYVECAGLVSPEEVAVRTVDAHRAERWSDAPASDDAETIPSDTEPANAASEMYYTASSEVSLLSDEAGDRPDEDARPDTEAGAMAGHVAAMRERFESMTRCSTPAPCPDAALDVFGTGTPAPDRLP